MRMTLVCLLLFTANVTWAGGTVGNGGDHYAIEFIERARLMQTLMVGKDISPLSSPDAFKQSLDRVKVESTEEDLILEGAKKDAINYPKDQRIVLNRKAWRSLPNERTRLLLVLHEYLGVMEIEDFRYDSSSRILSRILKNSLTCTSIFLDVDSKGRESGKLALDISENVRGNWSDSLFFYSVDVSLPILTLTVLEPNSNKSTMIKAQLNPSDPYFDFIFPVAGSSFGKKGSTVDVEVECK